VLARYRLSISIVLAAFAATGAVFAFARPEYHPPNGGRQVSLAKFEAPAEGWTWEKGQPGFRFGDHEADWNISRLRPSELARASAAASRFGVDPQSVRPLHTQRLAPHDLLVLVSGSGRSGKTCLGAVVPRGPVAFVCAPKLGPQVAFVTVAAKSWPGFRRRHVFPLFVMGVARADVERVDLTAPGFGTEPIYAREGGWWGTFEASPGVPYPTGAPVPKRPWRARLDFYGDGRRLLAQLRISLARPVEKLVEVD
jgi:hypothetical protein